MTDPRMKYLRAAKSDARQTAFLKLSRVSPDLRQLVWRRLRDKILSEYKQDLRLSRVLDSRKAWA